MQHHLARTRRLRFVFAALYFAEGAPMGFLWWALPVRLRGQGVEPAAVAILLSWLVLPWAFKFLWAPLIDRVQGMRFGMSGWLLVAQTGMGVAFVRALLSAPADSRRPSLALV